VLRVYAYRLSLSMSDNIAIVWPCWQCAAEVLVALRYPKTQCEHLPVAM
jgi:hypothetical protein